MIPRRAALIEDELDGFFESHDGDAPEWLCMLTAYIDETIDEISGNCIVAGYLGKSKNWEDYVDAWNKAMGRKKSLHLAKMRLGSSSAPRKYEALLKRLAKVPKTCGLKPFVGSICEKDYRGQVEGTVLEPIMEGYVLAILALMDRIGKHLKPDERIAVFFEQRADGANQRERAMICWNSLHRTSRGKPVVSKWGSTEKCSLTEAADYLCYALYHREIDRSSQKAILTSPILDEQRYSRNHQGKEVVDKWLKEIAAKRTKPIPKLTAKNLKEIRSGL